MIKALVAFAIIAAGAPLLTAADLTPEALRAWDAYVAKAESEMNARLTGRRSFFWADESIERNRRLADGEIVVSPVVGNGIQPVPNGLIHHWIGAVFIPNARLPDLFRVLHAYSCYKRFYAPFVAESKALADTEGMQSFLMIFQYQMVLATVAIEAKYEKHDFMLTGSRGYSIAKTTEVREIQAYGRAGERRMPPGTGGGLVWRMNSIARYEERNGGICLEVEAMALTRDIPGALRWLVCPMVKHVSMNSLATTLQKTRDGVISLPQSVEMCRSCGDEQSTRDGQTKLSLLTPADPSKKDKCSDKASR